MSAFSTTLLTSAVCLSILLAPLTVDASPKRATDVHQQVQALLATRDAAVTPEQWRAVPGALPELERLAADRSELPTRRARAIEGMVALGSTKAPKLLVQLSRSEDEPFVVRMSAIRGTARTLSASRQLAALQPVLEGAKDASLRGLTAEVLSQHPTSCRAVAAQAKRETDDWRGRYDAAVSRCSKVAR